MLYKIAVSIATDITPLINLSVLLSTNNATAVENGTILQSAADRLHHPKLHHSPKVVITIPGEPQRNSEANELNTTLNAPETLSIVRQWMMFLKEVKYSQRYI